MDWTNIANGDSGSSIRAKMNQLGAAVAGLTGGTVGGGGTTPPPSTGGAANIFAGATQGVWLDVDPAYLFSDRAGTVPATVGGIVNYIKDRSGDNNHAVAITDTDGYILREPTTGKYRLESDGVKKGYVIEPGAATDFAQVAWTVRFQGKTNVNWQSLFMKPHALGAHTAPHQRWGFVFQNGADAIARSNGANDMSGASVSNQYTVAQTLHADLQTGVMTKDGAAYGTDIADTAAQTYPTAGVPLRIGSNGAGGEVFNGFFEGLIIVNRSMTASEVTLAAAAVEQL